MATTVKIPLTLEMSPAAFGKIAEQVEGEGSDAQKVSLFVNEVVMAISNGAMLLPSETAERLADIDPELEDPDAIVAAVELGLGVSDGQMVARWKIDPSLHEEIRQRGEVQGMSVEGLVQEMMDQAVALGWFWSLEPRVKTVFLDREKTATLDRIIGGEFTSDDLVEYVTARNAENPRRTPEQALEKQLEEGVRKTLGLDEPKYPNSDMAKATEEEEDVLAFLEG